MTVVTVPLSDPALFAPVQRPLVDEVVLTLPEPPSVNQLYANGRPGQGRFKTRRYKNWIGVAGWQLVAQKPGRIEGPYTLDIAASPTRKDVDNTIKAISDLLQAHCVIANDRLARRVNAERDDTRTDFLVTVRRAS